MTAKPEDWPHDVRVARQHTCASMRATTAVLALLLAAGASAGHLEVAVSNVTSNVAICIDGEATCQLNLHIVHWISPTSRVATQLSSAAMVTYTYADGTAGDAFPLHTRSEYTLHDTTNSVRGWRATTPAFRQ